MIRVGLIVPPLDGVVPPDAVAMYPDVTFEVAGLGVRGLTAEGYAEAVARVEQAAKSLAGRGAAAILLFGTSMSFFKGPAFNAELESVMRDAAGVPAMTLTSAMGEALAGLRARRIAVATAYTTEVDALFRRYFEAAGFSVERIAGLGITALPQVEALAPETIAGLAERVAADAPGADAVVLSCAGLRTASIVPGLERTFGKPVISSAMVGSWAAVRLAGLDGTAPGMGRLYETGASRAKNGRRTV
ncbi:MAG: aspartate/glutamate racemase family protein [Rhizobiaceae bacterium]